MAKHKKYNMLLAKAENMDLIILLNYQSLNLWEKSPNAYPPNNDHTKAFLCLPKHQDSCISCLNGETIQIRQKTSEWINTDIVDSWGSTEWYMSENFESRIIQGKEE